MTNGSKTLLVLGATSGLAHAYLRQVASEKRFARYVLVGRNHEKLAKIRDDIAARSAAEVSVLVGELAQPQAVAPLMQKIKESIDVIDECFLAYGSLGEQSTFEQDQGALLNMLNTNFVSAVVWMEAIAKCFQEQGAGQLVVIGSVAGDRGRQSNYLYGATKSGLERVCEGMSHRFAAMKDISVTLVKPGFMDTPMTDHLDKSGPLWAKPEDVAKSIRKAVDKKRVRIYTPWFWRGILIVVRLLPVPILHKTKM
jgi:short-subunit dehydrogenase